ncbi:NosR/NirI family protein [Ideonella livida]|uniref:Regulatory protein NosR n=1 Tax=Ideonella livida TaxID=2707176 RepID=A0A7C9PKQ4_9BURK|nr:NosR/NirI family protein [Ideonella livida]NDY93592.1 regulatory protein NosR [Ideonella livida]
MAPRVATRVAPWLVSAGVALALALAWAAAQPAQAAVDAHAAGTHQAYEAHLPDDLATAPELCARVPCAEVFPGALSFSPRKGQPPYVEAYGAPDAQGRPALLGYVMLSTDITDTPAYSGKPVVTLIGMDVKGRYVGVKVLKHSEPILLLGIPEQALVDFNHQYLGRSVTDLIEVGPSRPEENILGVDAISGATVTVVAQNQVMQLSGQAVARQVGLVPATQRPSAQFQPLAGGQRLDWASLVARGLVQRLRVEPPQVGLPPGSEPFIELWFGDLNHPDLALSLLGERGRDNLRARLQPGEHALFIIRTAGAESFKGSGFVRGGIYDRVQVKQEADAFTFRDLDYLNLYGLEAAGAPAYTESALFILRSPAFSAAYPWKLAFLGNRVDRATGQRSFAVFESRYWLPDAALQGGRPAVTEPDAPWLRIWKAQAGRIGAFALLLVAVAAVYAQRDRLTRRATHKNKWPVNAFKYSAWALSIGVVGFGLMAQPSVTQVLTWFHSLLFQWTWSLFLSDPFIFLFWIFIIATTFVFGRGLFCGWLCPFGSLSEALFKLGRRLGLRRWQKPVPQALHDRLKWLKYALFFGLLVVSLFDMGLAEMLAEVEPFKTTFLVGVTHRAWPYGLYVAALLGLSLFIERPYCKYLCPLGGALAMPSTFRWFGLQRKADCNRCKACAVGCGAQAIDADGRIDHRECLHCLDCMVLYTDEKGCPPLARERKRRERDGLLITPIGADGYYIPIDAVPAIHPQAAEGPDPRWPTARITPPQLGPEVGTGRWLLQELRQHLLPWSRDGWTQARTLQIIGLGLALAASAAWVLGAQGRLPAAGLIGCWFGWSVAEVLLRWHGQRWVKDGPWWGRTWRVAGVMDLLSYVAFKNLMIGAALFLVLRAAGRLSGGLP